jgi:hypothetical protein
VNPQRRFVRFVLVGDHLVPSPVERTPHGVEFDTTSIRKGAVDSILSFLNGGSTAAERPSGVSSASEAS